MRTEKIRHKTTECNFEKIIINFKKMNKKDNKAKIS